MNAELLPLSTKGCTNQDLDIEELSRLNQMVLSSYLSTQMCSSIQLRSPLQSHFHSLLTSIALEPSYAGYKTKLNPSPRHYYLFWYLLSRRDSEMKCLVENRFARKQQRWICSMVGKTEAGAKGTPSAGSGLTNRHPMESELDEQC